MNKYLAAMFIAMVCSFLLGASSTFSNGCALALVPNVGGMLASLFFAGVSVGLIVAIVLKAGES